jgi:hypothetical protein
MRILAIDPGESSGWISLEPGGIEGGTVKLDRHGIWCLLVEKNPKLIIFESFKLYATHAKSMIGNKFYTCEIIGIIKLFAEVHGVKLIEQGADIKKYSSAKISDTAVIWAKGTSTSWTEHTYDAYMHLKYYLRKEKLLSLLPS